MDRIHRLTVEPETFAMELLPSFASFLLKDHLEEYVEKMIEFSEAEELPLLKKLDKFSPEQLRELGRTSHGEILEALASNSIHRHIEQNVKKWAANDLEVIDKDEVVAEDVTLSAFIKRKCLQHFVPRYTNDGGEQEILRREIDRYTTQEELISYHVYMRLQQDKLNKINEALKFQEALLLEAQDLSELGSFFTDYLHPENSMATPQVAKITGLGESNYPEFFAAVHPDDRDMIMREWEEAVASGGEFDYTFRYTRDGITKRVHSRGIVTRENGEVRFVKGTLRDITKSAELIERLTESEQLNNEAQKLTHLGNWSWDIETGSIQWSDEMYRIYGLEPQSEVITFERFISLVHPDFRQTRIDEINESLKSGIVKDYTLKIVTASGEVKVLRGLGSIAQDKQGKPIKLVGTCQDITEEFRLKSELLDLNKELSEKNVELTRTNKELESFNYIASHDLQEPLRKIELYSEKIICQAESLPADVNITLGKVTSAAARMRNLINDIMAFSQISLSTPVFETLPLNLVFDEGAEFFAEAVEQGQAIFNIGPLADAAIIPSQFRQLLANIFGNAIKYKNPSEAAVINVTGSVVSAEAMSFQGASGNYFRIAISDNGIGFDPEQRDNIFDLFKRLHSNEDYSGTGIGLAICKKIMQNHNGYISADGKPGEGSTFNLYLPYQ